MRGRSVVVSASVAFASLALVLSIGSAGATENLASADFENDAVGSVARNLTGETVGEQVYDHSTTSLGKSEVVERGSGNVYLVSNVGSGGASKGIRAPLSTSVSSGTLVVEAVVAAEQTSSGGDFFVSDPNGDDWLGRTKFSSTGTLSVHGLASTQPYEADHRYRVTMTFHFDILPTVDYLVFDLDASATVIDSAGHVMPPASVAGNVLFRANGSQEGAFTIDDLLATR